MPRHVILIVVFAALAVGSARAQEGEPPKTVPALRLVPMAEKPAGDATDPAFAALEKEFLAAQDADRGRRRRKADPADGAAPPAPEAAFFPRFRKLADEGSGDALVWCLGHADDAGLGKEAWRAFVDGALGLVVAKHAGAPCASRAAALAARFNENDQLPDAATLAFLAKLREASPSPVVKGDTLAAEARVHASSIRPEAPEMEAACWERLLAAYPDHPQAPKAKGRIFRVRHLRIGMKAPELEGKDVDGKPIRLADFAGKVVVLEFWGFW